MPQSYQIGNVLVDRKQSQIHVAIAELYHFGWEASASYGHVRLGMDNVRYCDYDSVPQINAATAVDTHGIQPEWIFDVLDASCPTRDERYKTEAYDER